jgi:hypothetical protein
MLPVSLKPPSHPPLPSFEAFIADWGGMEEESSAISGSWLIYRLTTMSSA